MLKQLRSGLAVVLVLMMILSVAACGNQAATPETNSTSTAVEQNSTTQAGEQTKAPEPVKLTFFGMNQGFTTGEQEDDVSKEIARVTGVTLVCEAVSSNPEEQLMAKLASGDLPDLLQVSGNQYLPQMIEGDKLLALDDLIQTNGKDILANGPAKIDYSKKAYSNNTGKLYIIPAKSGPAVPPAQVQAAHYIRWDYYKELGYPEFQTDLDLIPILAQMQAKHPKNADGKKVYALSPFFDWGLYNFTMLSQLHGVDEWTLQSDINQFTGDITSYADDNAWIWKNIQFYNKGYQLGILDPDCVTQSYSNFAEKAKTGRTLHTWWADNVSEANTALSAQGPDVGFMGVLPKNVEHKILGEGAKVTGGPARLFGISKSSKNPDRAMDLLNYLNSFDGAELIYNGVKGKNWDVDASGKAQLLDSTISASLTDPEFQSKTGINNKWNEMAGLWLGSVDERYGSFVDLWAATDTRAKLLSPLQKDYCTFFNIATPTEYSYEPRQGITDVMFQTSARMDVTPDDMQKINDAISSTIQTDGVKLMFSKNDAEFNTKKAALIKKLKDLGADKLLEYTKTAVAKARAGYEETLK